MATYLWTSSLTLEAVNVETDDKISCSAKGYFV